jgi:hypothetical protein
MSDFSKLFAAIDERDAAQVRSLILANEFVLISVSEGEDDDEENVGALTAEIGEFDVLVAFTSEQNAGVFVGEMGELFEDEEGVDGVVVDGEALLEYLPDGFGLLLNPEVEDASIVDPTLAAEVASST